MIPRRFLNLVMSDMRTGVGGSYWVSRMKPEANLFYPYAVEAVAQASEHKRSRYKPAMESTLELPLPSFRFRSSRALDPTLAFLPFYGIGGGPSEGRVVVTDSGGHSLLYDAEDDSAEILPHIYEGDKWPRPISLCVTNPKNDLRPDALYTINQVNSANFRSLIYCKGDTMAWRWLDLPAPPYFYQHKVERTIQSHTLLGDDGKTLCFSGGFGTYCYDTDSEEWTKAGSWTLPFDGHALRVPELYNLYFGFHETNPDILVALELSSPLDGDEPPKVLHQWRGFYPPQRATAWSLMNCSLLYLGTYRFCVAKWFGIYRESPFGETSLLDVVAVLTGVEILNGQGNKDKLQMVTHKTRSFVVEDHSLEAVI